MARRQGGRGRSIREVAGDILRRLTSLFRLGPYGSREAGQPAAASRARLFTPEQIVEQARLQAMQMPAPPQQRWRWSYICVWYDASTGDRIGEWRWNVETDSGTNYQQASAAARRDSFAHVPPCVAREQNRGVQTVLRCRRIGQPILF